MNDGAIDFRKLLKEEKKKARRKQQEQQQQEQKPIERHEDSHDHGAVSQSQSQSQPTSVNNNRNTKTPINIVDQNYTIREEDVDAIDFDKLRQAEFERSLRRQREQSIAGSWSIPPDVFDRTNQLVCSNPPYIYYVANFLPFDEHQQELMEWLQLLPDNPRGTSLQQPKENNADDNQSHNGAWTAMHYAKRRVALFDATVTKSNSTGTTKAARVTGSNDNQNDKNNQDNNDNATHDFPAPLQRLVDAFVAQGIFPPEQAPNHILINEYHPGQGILPHTDGPAYVSRTATLSLGSDVLIQFAPRPNYDDNDDNDTADNSDETTSHQLWLEKGSLLVFEDSAYLNYCHGIADRVLEETVSPDCLNAPSTTSTIQRGYRISLTFRHKHPQQRCNA